MSSSENTLILREGKVAPKTMGWESGKERKDHAEYETRFVICLLNPPSERDLTVTFKNEKIVM
jgi:hypothetical protein